MTEDQIAPDIDGAGGVDPPPPAVPRGDQVIMKPVCHVHMVQMVSYGTKPSVTYYRCPVENCTATEKRSRSLKSVIPRSPQMCPRCDVACEADHPGSREHFWRMVCPKGCGFAVNIPRRVNDGRSARKSPGDIMDV